MPKTVMQTHQSLNWQVSHCHLVLPLKYRKQNFDTALKGEFIKFHQGLWRRTATTLHKGAGKTLLPIKSTFRPAIPIPNIEISTSGEI